MARKTLDQQIAATADRLNRLKNRARSARTHRLCQFGGAFDSIISDQLLADMRLLTDDELAALRQRIVDGITRVASPRRPASAAAPSTPSTQSAGRG